jgi:transketolase
LIGGSADLAHSNLTLWKGSKNVLSGDPGENYIYFGVREFGMTAISSGLALHGGFLPYDATFLVFSDYARNGVRMSALIPARVVHVYTHDSIGLGEDGPTHQPIEHLASLRYIPNNRLWRPCDAVESAYAWRAALERRDGPTCLVFTRQNLAHQQRDEAQLAAIGRGAYVLLDPADAKFSAIVIATGSEVELAMQAARRLQTDGIGVRVVSMPCTEVFDAQPLEYRESVLPGWCRARVAVEAGVSDFWRKYVGLDGAVVGIDSFGASAPAEALFPYFGFSVEHVVTAIRDVQRKPD